MHWYYILGIVILIAVVALVAYFATRQPVRTTGPFGTGVGGSGTSIGNAIGGIFGAAGGVASSIGSAVDAGHTSPDLVTEQWL